MTVRDCRKGLGEDQADVVDVEVDDVSRDEDGVQCVHSAMHL
jgi:hypothetical protein